MPAVILKDKYSEFTYNSKENQYVANGIVDEELFDNTIDCVVKFNDGKLEFVKVADASGSLTFTFSNYGTTVVTLPTEYIEQ